MGPLLQLLVLALLVMDLAQAPHHVHAAGAHSTNLDAMSALQGLASPLSPSATLALLRLLRAGELQFCTANTSSARIYCANDAINFRGVDVCILLLFNYGYKGQTCSGVSNSSQNQLIVSTFFFPSSLGHGKVLHLPPTVAQNVELNVPTPNARFLPRALASSLHLDVLHTKELMKMYGVLQGSYMEATMNSTLAHCSSQPSPHETTACHASLESMETFINDTLGPNSIALRPTTLPPNVKRAQVIEAKYLNKPYQRVVSCHAMGFPSLLYSCHMAPRSQVVTILLRSATTPATARAMKRGVSICHHDTSYWNAQHPVFNELHTKPGKGTICHWLPHGSFIFIQKVRPSNLGI